LTKKKQQSLIILEREHLLLDHQEVGRLIAEKWKLNTAITKAICLHHNPELASDKHKQLVAVISVADFFVCLFDIGYAGNVYPDEEQVIKALDISGLSWQTVSSLLQSVEEEIVRAEIFLQV
jgi:HD-like signal output (HDOD) protein